MHMFYFIYSIAVCKEKSIVNLIKELKQLDDLSAHIHNTIFLSSSSIVWVCVCVFSCLKYS